MNKKEVHINVAPLVDVMLVLLIIFMVATPVMQGSIPLELPKTGKTTSSSVKNIVVSVSANGTVYVDQKRVPLEQLGQYLQTMAKPEDTIQFRADKRIHYGKIFEIINRLVDDGYHKISLMAEVKN